MSIFLSNTNNNQTVNGLLMLSATSSGLQINTTGFSASSIWTYEIGQYVTSQGGVIFHREIIGSSQSYWIVARTDISSSSVWSNISTNIGASVQNFINGLTNSNLIVAQSGHTTSAAKLCLDWVNQGQSDWYLPSLGECNLLLTNFYLVSKGLRESSSDDFIHSSSYWCSTEYEVSGFASRFILSNHQFSVNAKSSLYRVRAVRKITI